MAFPTTGILDDFNRANQGPPPSASWTSTGIASATPRLRVISNELRDDLGVYSGGGVWGTVAGPDSENYLTLTTLNSDTNSMFLWVRAQDTGLAGVDGYLGIFYRIDANPGARFEIYRIDNGGFTQLGATVNDTAGVLAPGVKFGIEVVDDTINTYMNRSGTWDLKATFTGDTTYTAAGSLAVSASDNVWHGDDFGGGTVVVTPSTDILLAHFSGRGAGW